MPELDSDLWQLKFLDVVGGCVNDDSIIPNIIPVLIPRLFSRVYNVILSFNELSSKWTIDRLELLPEQFHPQITVEELTDCEVVVKNDPTVQALAREVGAFDTKAIFNTQKILIQMQEYYLSKYFVMAGR